MKLVKIFVDTAHCDCYFVLVLSKLNGFAVLIMILSFGFQGCSSQNENKRSKLVQGDQLSSLSNQSLVNLAPEPVPGPAPQAEIPVPSKLVGLWVKSCSPVAGDEEGKSAYSLYEEMNIGANGELAILRAYYEGTKCRNNNLVQRTAFTGTFSLTQDFIKASEDFKARIVYWDQKEINQLNETSTCGSADWKYAVEHEDCSTQQGQNVLNAQYSITDRELAIFSCETDDLTQCSSEVFWLAK